MGGWAKSFVCLFFPIFAVFYFLFFIYHRSDRIGGYLIMGGCSVFGVLVSYTRAVGDGKAGGRGSAKPLGANETSGFKHFHIIM